MAKVYQINFGSESESFSGKSLKSVRDEAISDIVQQGIPKELAIKEIEKRILPQAQVERNFLQGLFKDALARSKDPIKDFRKFALWADELDKPLRLVVYDKEQLDCLRESFNIRITALKERAIEVFLFKDLILQIENPEEKEI